MKNILVPTDFSPVSNNAIDYAAELAKTVNGKITLFHVYHVPPITTDVPVTIPSLDIIESAATESLKQIEKDLRKKYGNSFGIDHKCVCGFAVDEIHLFCKNNHIDLLVMGMHGGGWVTEKLIGSVTTSLLRKSQCPVLAIDQKTKFKAPGKIALACDYKGMENISLAVLKEFAMLFQSHIYVVNVVSEPELCPAIPVAVNDFIQLEGSLKNVDHSVHCVENESVVDGINAFITTKKMELLVMIPREHSFIYNLLHEPNTKKMAFHTTVPILALH